MQNNFERLVRAVYKNWKSTQLKTHWVHPDPETFACFLEGRLSPDENEEAIAHIMSCSSCTEALRIQAGLKDSTDKEVPKELIERIKNLALEKQEVSILEIILRLKDQALEIINTTGDVLVGQEFIPAPILRSRQIKDFKDEITILKDFKDIRIELKLENKHGKFFTLTVLVKEKKTQEIIKNLRIALLRGNLELESYLNDSGKVTFEHVLLGKYTVEITDIKERLASIYLDIKT